MILRPPSRRVAPFEPYTSPPVKSRKPSASHSISVNVPVATSAADQIAAEIPGARYVSLPSANHLMLEEEPAWSLFLEELGLFLNW